MQKTLYIIPGFFESSTVGGYKEIARYAKLKGYKVVAYTPVWKWNTIDRWVKDFITLYKKNNTGEVVALGFSFGALIALLSQREVVFDKLLLCSLSPYFPADISKLPKIAFKIVGIKRMNAFRKSLSKDMGIQKIPKQVDFLYGDKEMPILVNRVKELHKSWKGKKTLTVVKDAPHDINEKAYIEAVKKALS